ncbi:MAG: NAD(P)/FAD-dependent oxidoreductase [Bryobacteraceae bacterium]|nr:NAD(P)/FAD-dependent oxidoreductase [Bryobacteraceae bacterium]
MKKVAVLGGGPAGAMAAAKLASAGIETVLLDEKLAWEKPCGGGLTWKAYDRYPFLLDNSVPKRLVTHTGLDDPRSGHAMVHLTRPLVIYSRKDLNALLLDRAARMGARLLKERVQAVQRDSGGWRVQTRTEPVQADYVIVALGARNHLKEFGSEFAPGDTMTALGYHVDAPQSHIDLQFFPSFEGYSWIFPRCGRASVGIGGKGESAQSMRYRLEQWMERRGLPYKNAPFYAHMIPALEPASWVNNRVSGEGWMAAGDTAGLVDPVTGEGIYYALRSGEMAAETLLDASIPWASKHVAYREALRREIMDELAAGSRLAPKLYLRPFLFSGMTARMIQFIRHSPAVSEVMQNLFAGSQSYIGLKSCLVGRARRAALEIMQSVVFRRRLVEDVK